MSIVSKSGVKFSFIAENGLETIAPLDSEVYVHVTDGGNGTHSVNGRVQKKTETGVQELGWVRTSESLPSNTTDLLLAAEAIVISKLVELNPKVIFESTL